MVKEVRCKVPLLSRLTMSISQARKRERTKYNNEDCSTLKGIGTDVDATGQRMKKQKKASGTEKAATKQIKPKFCQRKKPKLRKLFGRK